MYCIEVSGHDLEVKMCGLRLQNYNKSLEERGECMSVEVRGHGFQIKIAF